MDTAYYHISDPLENFVLKVVVREISRAATSEAISPKSLPPFLKDGASVYISWQEKIPGPGDIVERMIKSGSSSNDGVDGKSTPQEELSEVMLYTYVDKDHFWTDDLPALLDVKVDDSYVGAAVFSQTPEGDTAARGREIKAQKRVTREKPFKSFHVCLATDIDVEALKTKKPRDVSSYLTEHVLCSIRLYRDGLLEVSPGFARITEEAINSQVLNASGSQYYAGLSPFLDDTTIQGAVTKGFRLSTRKLRSHGGTEFEYCIANVNEIYGPHQLDDLLTRQRLVDMKTLNMNRSVGESHSWKQDPPAKDFDKSVAVYAEIVSGKDFSGGSLFVNYQVSLPQGWDLRTGNLSDGMAEKDIAEAVEIHTHNANSNAHDGMTPQGGDNNLGELDKSGIGEEEADVQAADLLALDGYADGIMAQGMLYGTTHTAIARNLRVSTAAERPKWRGAYAQFAYPNAGTRIFLGTLFFLITVIAIILGADYPWWFVPALVIVFVLGTGYPGGTIQLVLSNTRSSRISGPAGCSGSTASMGAEKTSYKVATSSSQRRLVGNLVDSAVAHFNHLINLSFDVKDLEKSIAAQDPFPKAPTVHFQVYSVGWFERCVLEGYGYFTLPDRGGMVDVEVKTWRPQGDIKSKMMEFFLGSSARLKSPAFAEIPNKASSALNRFGLLTESSGSVRIRCQVIVTDPRIVAKTQQMKEVEEEISKSLYRQRTVDEILSGLRASGGLRKLSGTRTSFSRGVVNSSMDSEAAVRALELLKAKSKEDHVAEVLAKARSRFLNKLDSASASANADSNSSDMTPLLRRNNSRDRMRVSPRTSVTGSDSGSSIVGGGGGSVLSASPTLRGVTPRGGTRDYRYHQTDTIREDDEENDRDSRDTRDNRDRDRDRGIDTVRDRDNRDSAQESDPLVSRSVDFGRGLGIADRAGRRQR